MESAVRSAMIATDDALGVPTSRQGEVVAA
jgi:hypothetical protein